MKEQKGEERSSLEGVDEVQLRSMAERLKEMMVFENEHLIVINKDNGVPSQMGTGLSLAHNKDISVDKMLEAYIKLSGDGISEGKLVHRLDRKTSGLLALAKNKEMAAWLSHLFKERSDSIQKSYFALLCGVPKFKEGLIR